MINLRIVRDQQSKNCGKDEARKSNFNLNTKGHKIE